MVVPYTENDNCYVLTNFAVANNPIFMDEDEVNNFKKRLEDQLVDLCDILSYNFHSDHYQIVVALRDRSSFIHFFRKKKDDADIPEEEIPESTYILSQEMANIQSGYAKWFNFRHGRYGTVFGRRYTKILIETEEELKVWVDEINKGSKLWSFEDFWSYTRNFLKRLKELKTVEVSSGIIYEIAKAGKQLEEVLMNFITLEQYLLRGPYIAKLPT